MFGQQTPAATSTFGQQGTTTFAAPLMGGGSSGTAPANTTSTFGGFGSSVAATTPSSQFNTMGSTQQPNPMSLSTITKETKYEDLPEATRKNIDEIERFIQSQITLSQSLFTCSNLEMIQYVSKEAQTMQNKLKTLRNILDRDGYVLDELRKNVMKEFRYTELGGRYIERFTNPHQASYNVRFEDDTTKYFVRVTETLEQRAKDCFHAVNEIERFVEHKNGQDNFDLDEISKYIKMQYNVFISIANKIAELHEAVLEVKDQVQNYQKRYFGSKNLNIDNITSGPGATPLKVIARSIQPTSGQFAGAAPFSTSSTAGTQVPGLFGTSMFGKSTTPTAAALTFGAPTTAVSAPSMFGSSNPTAASMFGSTAAAVPSTFGSTTASTFTGQGSGKTRKFGQ